MEQSEAHIKADADHTPVADSAYGDDLSDNCKVCGLATTSDARHHGFDN